MSLLDNLTLSYEVLDDDPIAKGIHYGQSLLELLPEQLSFEAKKFLRPAMMPMYTRGIQRPTPQSQTPSEYSSLSRGSVSLHSRRGLGHSSSQQLVGAL